MIATLHLPFFIYHFSFEDVSMPTGPVFLFVNGNWKIKIEASEGSSW